MNSEQGVGVEAAKRWCDRGEDYFTTLLSNMAEAVGYHFDKVHLKKAIYTPNTHVDKEEYSRFMQESFKQIMKGKLAIPITFIAPDEVLKRQEDIQNNLLKVE